MSLEEDYDDEAADLYRKWLGRVQGFLINIGCDQGLAEEITDDAFLGARRRWAHVRTLEAPEGTSSRSQGTSAASARNRTTAARKISILTHLRYCGTLMTAP
jgi:hypothetical protein